MTSNGASLAAANETTKLFDDEPNRALSALSDRTNSDDSNFTTSRQKEGGAVNCEGCGQDIRDRYLLRVGSALWHQECLCCAVCKVRLDSQPTCFLRGDSVYCRLHYNREFGRQCAKCNRQLAATDWVRRAGSNVYHLACFACYRCQRQLSTGEQFALRDDRVLCKAHYLELVEGNNSKDEAAKPKTKRVRTTFTEEQLQVLQANFEVDSNPDGQDLERIAHITGLSKRVTQVWFQNSRARQKKHKEKKILNNNSSSANKNITSFQSKSINDFGPGQTVTLDLRWATADVSSPNSDVYSDQSEMDFEESMDAIYSAPTPL